MISARNLLSYFAVFVAFYAFYAVANPIVGDKHAVDLIVRGGTCGSCGCNEQSLLDILLDLKAKVDVKIALLNGHNDPVAICTDIAVYIKAALALIAAVDINVSGSLGPLISDIVVCLASILKGIIGGCGNYPLLTVVLKLVIIIDAILADLVGACCKCCPGLLALIAKELLGSTWNLLGFLLTFLACGLGL